LSYFDYDALKHEREDKIRVLPSSVKEQIWSWLVLFTDRDSADSIKSEFHRLTFEPISILPEQSGVEELRLLVTQ